MKIKLFEVLDRATLIAAIGIELNLEDGNKEKENSLIRHAGYGHNPIILFGRLGGGNFSYDSYSWGDRTMQAAHDHIENNWNNLESGDVIDVEYILGETEKSKVSDLSSLSFDLDHFHSFVIKGN